MITGTDKFFLDFLQDNPAWEELFSTMSEVNNDFNLESIRQLLNIRKIDKDTDTEIVENSIRQLGINITRDIMSYRIDNLKRIFDTLPDYSLVSGTSAWDKFVSILLGAEFHAERLYTGDYSTFLPTPLGMLIQDGGTWYKTTHVDVSVDAQAIGIGLDLTIDAGAQADIVAALQRVGMSEADATQWFIDHLGFDPVNFDIHQVTARGVMYNRRITELFYQWSPIEDVLHSVQKTISIASEIFIGAHTVVEPVRRFFVGKPLLQSLAFIEPEYVHGGESVTFGVLVSYSDGTSKTDECYVQDMDLIESRDGNAVVFKEPNSIKDLDLSVLYKGNVHKISTRLYPLDIEPDPVSLDIIASSLYGNSRNKLTVYGNYKNGTQRDLSSSSGLTISTDLGTIDGTDLVLPSVATNTTLTLKANFDGFSTVKRSQIFGVNRSVLISVPDTLQILIPDTITQGQDVQVQCMCTYNDGTSKIVVPQYMSTSKDVSVVESTLKSKVRRSNYMTNLVASFDDNGSVSTTVQLLMRAPINILATVDIIIPDHIQERDYVTPKAMGLYVSENATQAQIDKRDPSIVVAYQEISGTWFAGEDAAKNIDSLGSVDRNTGEFQAPDIQDGYRDFALYFSTIDGTMLRTFSSVFSVYDTVLVPKQVSIVRGSRIASGEFVSLPTVCLWSDGKTMAAAAGISVDYIPSDSAKEEARERTILGQQQAAATGGDPTKLDPNNPDYKQWVTLELSNSVNDLYDPVLQRQQPVQQLYFKGDLHGVARIHLTYIGPDDTKVTNTVDFQVVPVRSLVSAISIEMPDSLVDSSRTFARLFATYEDGTQEYVQAANWSGIWPNQDSDPYQVLQFIPGQYTGTAVVETIAGRVPTDIKDFRSMNISKLPMFDDIGTIDQLSTTLYEGAIVQVGKCNEAIVAGVRARFYRIAAQFDVSIVPTPVESINTILNSRIEGASKISAAVRIESYALIHTFQTGGIVQQLDGSYVQGEKKSFDMEASATWSIVNNWYTHKDGDAVVLEPTDDVIAIIDENGDLTPEMNVDGAVKIRAQYVCDGYAIEKFLTVYISMANTYLQSGTILGPEIFWDQSTRNPTVEYEDGRWYVPYHVRVILEKGNEIETTDALWSIGTDTNVDVISIDAANGHVYLVGDQISDGVIRINAQYSAINPDTKAAESLTLTRLIKMQSTRTILTGAITLPTSNIEPNKTYQAIAEYTRRDGQTGTSKEPDADTAKFAWTVSTSVPGFQLNSSTGEFSFVASKEPQTVKVECVITEQRTRLVLESEITCPGIGYPQDLTIVGFKNVRDDSSMQIVAQLGRTGTFVRDDVTSKTLWQTTNTKGDPVSLAGISINAQTGVLTLNKLLLDTNFGIMATYVENGRRINVVEYMTAFSSYPRFGTAQYGINTIDTVESNLGSRMRSSTGGSFVLTPKSDEYGYFAVRAAYGTPVFDRAADAQGYINPSWVGFDGAKWPITGSDGSKGPVQVKKVYDNVTDIWNIYRTNARAFGSAVITVRYT